MEVVASEDFFYCYVAKYRVKYSWEFPWSLFKN